MKPSKRRRSLMIIILRCLNGVYLCITLPLLLLFVWNQTCRDTLLNTASHYRSKILSPVRTVHIGDSITSGGGHWSMRLSGLPLDAYSLAGNGYTVHQIRAQADRAIQYKPEAICIMAGTNDVFAPEFDIERTAEEYGLMLRKIEKSQTPCIITLIPYTTSTTWQHEIKHLNARITALAVQHQCTVIDLNPVVAPKGILLKEYTTDGVHFSEPGYQVWAAKLRDALEHPRLTKSPDHVAQTSDTHRPNE